MDIDVRLATARGQLGLKQSDEPISLVTPGDVITSDAGFMRGHGTAMEEDRLQATVAGMVERVNKLISVRPLKSRYTGEIGDVVVGRILPRRPRPRSGRR